MRNYGLEDPEPRFAWVTTAKNLIQYPSYRRDWVKIRRREFRMFMKYDSYAYFEKFGLVALGLGGICLFANWKLMARLVRLPTEDVNELLKHDVWLDERNAINERKEQADKMLAESNYYQKRNSPIKE